MKAFLEILKVIVLGIVEGVTEWLPISSTGHMILLDELIHLDVRTEFMDVFLVVIQLGAILAVVVLYWNRLWPFYYRPLTGKQRKELSKLGTVKGAIVGFGWRFCDKEKWILWSKILVACLPTIVVALPFDDVIEEKLNNYVVVAICLIVYGVIFLLVEYYGKNLKPTIRRVGKVDYWIALIIGCFQVLALIPGTSRSGATIIGAMLAGCTRAVAAEFSFFMAVPVMLGASLLKIVKFTLTPQIFEIVLLVIGMVVAFFVSIFSIGFFMSYIRKNNFKVFGIYRIILGIVVLAFFLIRHLAFGV